MPKDMNLPCTAHNIEIKKQSRRRWGLSSGMLNFLTRWCGDADRRSDRDGSRVNIPVFLISGLKKIHSFRPIRSASWRCWLKMQLMFDDY